MKINRHDFGGADRTDFAVRPCSKAHNGQWNTQSHNTSYAHSVTVSFLGSQNPQTHSISPTFSMTFSSTQGTRADAPSGEQSLSSAAISPTALAQQPETAAYPNSRLTNVSDDWKPSPPAPDCLPTLSLEVRKGATPDDKAYINADFIRNILLGFLSPTHLYKTRSPDDTLQNLNAPFPHLLPSLILCRQFVLHFLVLSLPV